MINIFTFLVMSFKLVYISHVLIAGILFNDRTIFSRGMSWDKNEQYQNETFDRSHTYISGTEHFRSGRFLTFNNDASRIRVEMVFAIPFLAIPIGNDATELTNHHSGVVGGIPALDVNLKSLMAMGSILVTLFVIVPKLVKAFVPVDVFSYNRRLDGEQPNKLETILLQIQETLKNNNIETESCLQKVICSIFNEATEKVLRRNADGFEKILDGISSLFPMKRIFGNLWKWELLENAIEVSKNGYNACQYFHQSCPLTKNTITSAALAFFSKFH